MTAQLHLADDALLVSLGYKQEFKRAFTAVEIFGQTFNSIGLVQSLSSVIVYAIPYGGGPAMVWGWAVASFLVFFVALSIAELASVAPTSGGLYYWTHTHASPRCRNLLSWIVGYFNTTAYIAELSSTDWACSEQIAAAAAIGSNGRFIASQPQKFGIFVALIASHTLIGSLGTRALARLQNLYIVLNLVLCLTIIIAVPAATPSEYRNNASFALGKFINGSGWPNGHAFILSFLSPLWSIGGFDSAVHISEEATNAAIAVPWSIVVGTAVTGIFGWIMNIALAFSMGTDLNFIMNSNVDQPMAQILFQSLGKKGTLAVWAMIIVAQYTVGATLVVAASRQMFAFSRDGALPFSSWLYNMNNYTQTPVRTVWAVCGLALLLGLFSFAGAQAIGAIFTLAVVVSYISYIITIGSRFIFNKDRKSGPFDLGVFSFPVALIAVLFMTVMVVAFLFPAVPNPGVSGMNFTVVVLSGVLSLSLIYYYFPKYGGKCWFQGPVQTVDTSTVQVSEGAETEKVDHESATGAM